MRANEKALRRTQVADKPFDGAERRPWEIGYAFMGPHVSGIGNWPLAREALVVQVEAWVRTCNLGDLSAKRADTTVSWFPYIAASRTGAGAAKFSEHD